MAGLPRAFRRWSIFAFALESMVVVIAFLIMVFFFAWEINATMMYILILVMVISAGILLTTGRRTAEK